MKRFLPLLAACCVGFATTAIAQQPAAPAAAPVTVAPPKCEPKPEWPGRLATDSRRKLFDREMKQYKDCMNAYLDERKAHLKAHEQAANAAIEEHNSVMKKVTDDQKASADK
jgi:hypothetical protein